MSGETISGRCHVYGREHINTDEIIPARYLTTDDEAELAKHAMEDLDAEFPNKVQDGDILVAGRNFNSQFASDSTEAFILNESAVEAIGWNSPQQAIGKQFINGNRRGQVIGVVDDFNFESLHQSIAPIVFLIPTTRITNVSVKFRENMREETLSFLKEQWATLRPEYPFTYFFVEDNYDQQYSSEKRLGQIFGFFSLLAVIIASLGLFGLASFTTQQRFKEIGIRKVLGASVAHIVRLLSQRFTLLVLFSIVLASPIAYFAMSNWLSRFAYQADLPAWIFLAAGGIALVIAWLTISYQSLKAAYMNPVESLRSE